MYKANEAVGTNKILERVEEIAKKRDVSMAQVALAWILSKDGTLFRFSEATQLSGHSSCRGTDCGRHFVAEIERYDEYVLSIVSTSVFLFM